MQQLWRRWLQVLSRWKFCFASFWESDQGISILVSQAMEEMTEADGEAYLHGSMVFVSLCGSSFCGGGAGRSLAFKADEGAGRRHGGSG